MLIWSDIPDSPSGTDIKDYIKYNDIVFKNFDNTILYRNDDEIFHNSDNSPYLKLYH